MERGKNGNKRIGEMFSATIVIGEELENGGL